MNDQTKGLLFALGATVGWGCYGLPLKYFHVTDINPIILQFYFSIAIFCSSWLILLQYEFIFTPLGFIGAAIWTNTSIISFIAIKYAGLAIAQGTWSGFVIIVSFFLGAFLFHEPIDNLPVVCIGLILIFFGIILISACDTQIHLTLPSSLDFLYNLNWIFVAEYHDSEEFPLLQTTEEKRVSYKKASESQPLIPNYNISSNRLRKEDVKITHQFLIGVILAVLLGAASGCLFVPLKYLPSEFNGELQILYMVSFAIGIFSFSTLYLIIYILYVQFFCNYDWTEEFHIVNVGPGLLGGVLWSIGNYCGTFTIIYLGMAIGSPLSQASIIVAGLCGIIVLREITRAAAITQFFFGSLVLLIGCALLSLFS